MIEDIGSNMGYEDFYDEMVEKFKNKGHFVEVGCWLGRSGVYLLKSIQKNNANIVVDFVDTWNGCPNEIEHKKVFEQYDKDFVYNKFLENIRNADPNYNGAVIRDDSALAARFYENESLDFVFIDASHYYDAPYNDIKAWLPKVRKGGVLAGHDYGFIYVQRAVHNLLGILPEKPVQVWYYEK